MYIDISTEENKQKVRELFLNFSKKGDIFKYYGVSDNTSNTKYVRNLLKELEIDDNYYNEKKKKKKYCLYCGKEIENGDAIKKFCNSSCAAKYNNSRRKHSEETKKKIKLSVLKKYYPNIDENTISFVHTKSCKCCGKNFEATLHPKQEFCSRKCASLFRREKKIQSFSEHQIYRSQAKFNFALNAYPDEFDFTLIKESGWYKASNHGDNLKGISRDHMFSIEEGYKRGIDPYLISHPANCKLMKHEENFKKLSKCSITLEELIKRIEEWNKKYGVYENKISYEKIERFQNYDYLGRN